MTTHDTPRPRLQKTLGILGGMSDQATVEYYKGINRAINQSLGGWDIAECVIIGVNFGNVEYAVRNGEWDMLGEYLAHKSMAAERAGADVLICASNTVHAVAGRFTRDLRIPFIHIADPTAAAIKARGLNTVALLGTLPVMSEPSMVAHYRRLGVTALVPDAQQQQRIDAIIFDELVRGKINADSRAYYLSVCESLRAQGAEGVILGCTEICLLIEQSHIPDWPFFDTTALHIQAAAQALQQSD